MNKKRKNGKPLLVTFMERSFMKWVYRFMLPALVLLCVEAKSQAYSYHPFPDSNIVWTGYDGCGAHGSFGEAYWSYQITGDTSINGLLYKKLSSPYYHFCVREDSLRRVYFFRFGDTTSQERILYDFSLSVGDTFFSPLHYYVIDSIKTINYYSILRKTFYVSWGNNSGGDHDVWIEGIGSNSGPMGIWQPLGSFCYWSYLCGADQNSIILYGYPCHITSVGQEIADNNLKISPNPCTTTFTFQLSSPPNTQTYFQLYNAIGQPVKREEINTETTTLQRGNLPTGIYFWQLQQADKVLERGKLVME